MYYWEAVDSREGVTWLEEMNGTLTSPLPSSVSWPPGGQPLHSITPCSHSVQPCLRLRAMGAAYHGLQASGFSKQKSSFLLYSTFLRRFWKPRKLVGAVAFL